MTDQTGAASRAKRALRLAAALGLAAGAPAACTGATVRRDEAPGHAYPAAVVQMQWRATLNERGRFANRPEECASAAVVRDRLVVGSRAGHVVALSRDGRTLWSTQVSGAVDSEAVFDERHGHVYVGTDDGSLYALDPASGAIRWMYKSQGAIERPPALDADSVYVATAADRILALDAKTGKLRWQYDREPPEGFGIRGYAAPQIAGELVVAGFSDGFLVALRRASGEALWARSLAAASEQYVDVDTTPFVLGDTVYASSYSGGLYAVALDSGDVRWRLGVEGAGAIRAYEGRLYFAAPREGLTALSPNGHVLWRQGLADAGSLTEPQAVGPYLVFTGSRAGLFVVDRASGSLMQVFNPGRGMCGKPALDRSGQNAYVMANSGSLYALRVALPQ